MLSAQIKTVANNLVQNMLTATHYLFWASCGKQCRLLIPRQSAWRIKTFQSIRFVSAHSVDIVLRTDTIPTVPMTRKNKLKQIDVHEPKGLLYLHIYSIYNDNNSENKTIKCIDSFMRIL